MLCCQNALPPEKPSFLPFWKQNLLCLALGGPIKDVKILMANASNSVRADQYKCAPTIANIANPTVYQMEIN